MDYLLPSMWYNDGMKNKAMSFFRRTGADKVGFGRVLLCLAGLPGIAFGGDWNWTATCGTAEVEASRIALATQATNYFGSACAVPDAVFRMPARDGGESLELSFTLEQMTAGSTVSAAIYCPGENGRPDFRHSVRGGDVPVAFGFSFASDRSGACTVSFGRKEYKPNVEHEPVFRGSFSLADLPMRVKAVVDCRTYRLTFDKPVRAVDDMTSGVWILAAPQWKGDLAAQVALCNCTAGRRTEAVVRDFGVKTAKGGL